MNAATRTRAVCTTPEPFPSGDKLAALEADWRAAERWARSLSDVQLAAALEANDHPLRDTLTEEEYERNVARAEHIEERRNNGEFDDSPCLERPWWESP